MKIKLKTYHWMGITTNNQTQKGEIAAINIRFAKAELQKQQINIKKIARKITLPSFATKQKVTKNDITLLLRQLTSLIVSGIPLLQALQVIQQGSKKPSLKELINKILNDLKHGNSLSKTLAQHPKYFDQLTCQLIAAGEQSGQLDIMLERITTHREKIIKIKNKIKKALLYPCAVISAAIIVTTILLIFVVPQFAELFSGFGAQLPLLTRMVIALADFLKAYVWLVLLFVIFCGWLIIFLKRRHKAFATFLDKQNLRLPIFGKILQKSIIARITHTLAITFATGVPLIEALRTLPVIAKNIPYAQAIAQIHEDVTTGTTLNQSIHNSQMFPNMVTQMVAIGEEGGKLDEMLTKIALFYEAEVDQMVDELSQLLEPMVMMILGITIGGLIIAMYLPIFKLGTII
jgi:type IV pilus assembly protein PilC